MIISMILKNLLWVIIVGLIKIKKTDLFRGVSVISKPGEKFDLYLHGARAENGGESRLKIGENIKNNLFYTLQVLLGWIWNEWNFPDSITPAFYLGGFNASTVVGGKVVKSKCFTGGSPQICCKTVENLTRLRDENVR